MLAYEGIDSWKINNICGTVFLNKLSMSETCFLCLPIKLFRTVSDKKSIYIYIYIYIYLLKTGLGILDF